MAAEGRTRNRAAGRASDVVAPRRMPPREREQMILEEAIEFFAEFGFNAQVRHLADRMGVSQSLIFRYFGTKEALIERVYQSTFEERWNDGWTAMISESNAPLRSRLKSFLLSYIEATDDHRWIRISMHSSLAGHDLTRRYVEVHVTCLLRQIARQVRIFRGEDPEGEIGADELEVVWHLHSTVIYYLVRKHITKTPTDPNTEAWVGRVVDNFVDGLR